MSGEEGHADSQHKPLGDVANSEEFTKLLTRLIRAGNQLAVAPSIHELCRQAVETGLTQFGFERMSLWLVEDGTRMVRGTYGTDEHGNIRDERSTCHEWGEDRSDFELLTNPQQVFRQTKALLYNEAQEVVGSGEIGAAALWNGKEVVGLIYMDNLFSQQPIREEHWRIFELYASTLGHVLSLKRAELALRRKEELLSQILDIMPVGIFVLAPQEAISQFNRTAQEMWEFAPESIATWSPRATWVRERRAVEKHEWAGRLALEQGKSVLNQEVEIVRSDGTRRVLLNSGFPLHDSAGILTGSVILNQDITEIKRREQQLEALARMGQVLRPLMGRRGVLSAIVNNLAQMLFAQGVAVVLSNNENHMVFEAAVGDYAPLAGIVVPQELTAMHQAVGTAIRVLDTEQQPNVFGFQNLAQRPRYVVVAPLVAENFAMGAVIVGLTQAPDSAMVALVSALADVSASAIQRGQLYDEVTTQANRLDRVMESVNFGLVLLDPMRRVVLANQHAQTRLGQWANLAIGDELVELAGHKLGRFLTPRRSQSRTQEISIDGGIYEITTVPVGATGAEGGWLMVIHDVTRERVIQSSIQQNQRLAAVGQLAAGIAHDFNNIIAVIMLYVQMLQRNPSLQEVDHKRLNVIRDQAQNASKLIRQILDFSRQTVIERQATDLRTLVEESMALWERTLPESIALQLMVEFEGPAQILAEASSIQQALTNLAVNARDAMPNGGELRVVIRSLRVGAEEAPPVTGMKVGHWFEIYVIDTGEGIAPENLPHIFDPFFTTKDIGRGTGLGLAQVYGIVQQHGGLVTAQSEVGKGTSICLFLPALAEEMPVAQEGDAQEITGEGSETILLVEDNAPAREATSALLEMMGYRVFAAADGRAGLDLFRRHVDSIQLVLSDLIMPEMGGLELYRKIYEENPAICLLIMTGYPLVDEKPLLEEQGVVEWLEKPFTVKQLIMAVRKVLEKAKLLKEEKEEGRNLQV